MNTALHTHDVNLGRRVLSGIVRDRAEWTIVYGDQRVTVKRFWFRRDRVPTEAQVKCAVGKAIVRHAKGTEFAVQQERIVALASSLRPDRTPEEQEAADRLSEVYKRAEKFRENLYNTSSQQVTFVSNFSGNGPAAVGYTTGAGRGYGGGGGSYV